MDDIDIIMQAIEEMESDELKNLLQETLDLLDDKDLENIAREC